MEDESGVSAERVKQVAILEQKVRVLAAGQDVDESFEIPVEALTALPLAPGCRSLREPVRI